MRGVVLGGVLVLSGCAAPGVGAGTVEAAGEVSGAQTAGRATDWNRVIAPFRVLDPAGEAYEHPFLGGLVVPRPQLVDIDADGDPDLFIQERSGELMFLENTGSAARADFVWRTDRFEGLDIAEWYRFVDMDGDGDEDLLAEQPYSYVRYYRNDGSPTDPRFVLAADTVRTEDGAPLFSDRQNIPNATDVDCNGLVDLFIGRIDGTVMRYEETSSSSNSNSSSSSSSSSASTSRSKSKSSSGVPVFRLVSERFADIEIVNALMASLHGANTMDFADHDGDGDVDLFWGDFFEPGLLLLENRGSCEDPAISNDPVPFPRDEPIITTGYNAPTVADLNGDGRPDMLVGVLGGAYNPTLSSAANLLHLEQTASGFELRTRRYLHQIDLGSETVPLLIDDDGDGDLDLLVGAKVDPTRTSTGVIHRFENTGAADAPSFAYDAPLDITGAYHYAPAAGDLDGDGRPDLALGTWNDGVVFYRNTGDPAARWELVEDRTVTLTRGSNTTPALADLDGDGDLDLVVGEASGALNYYRNMGSAASPEFRLASDEWLAIDPGRRSHPALVDLDGDGVVELIVGNEDGELRVFRRNGEIDVDVNFDIDFEIDIEMSLPRWPYAAPAFGDLDGDGRLELVMGGLSGGLVFYRR